MQNIEIWLLQIQYKILNINFDFRTKYWIKESFVVATLKILLQHLCIFFPYLYLSLNFGDNLHSLQIYANFTEIQSQSSAKYSRTCCTEWSSKIANLLQKFVNNDIYFARKGFLLNLHTFRRSILFLTLKQIKHFLLKLLLLILYLIYNYFTSYSNIWKELVNY